jgi:myo-inositol-1(or 4)-monophosphatase
MGAVAPPEAEQWLDTCVEMAARAGEVMRRWSPATGEVTFKENDTPVTAADLEVNRMVLETVAARYPTHRVLGEELSSPDAAAVGDGPVWVCDPIDGTMPFTLGVPVSFFSVAVVVDGAPQVALCHEPWLGRTWTAVRGCGTRLDGRRVSVSATSELAHCYLGATGPRLLADTAGMVADLVRASRRVFMLGGTVAEAVCVADGGMAGVVFTEDTAVDVAATSLLVTEAGGRVTDLWGQPQRYDRVTLGAVLSNGVVHDELLALVAPYLHVPGRSAAGNDGAH